MTAIDAAQMPTEIQLIAILKNSISGAYKLLHVMLEVMVNLTLVQLKEKFINWEAKHEVGGAAEVQGTVRAIANFAGSGLDNTRKKAFVKKIKAGYKNEGAKFELDCWNCGLTGHLKRNCPQPDNSESSSRKRSSGGSGYESGGSGGSNSGKYSRRGSSDQSSKKKFDGKLKSILRKPTDQRRSPSPSRHSSSSNNPQRQGSRRNSTYSDASEGS